MATIYDSFTWVIPQSLLEVGGWPGPKMPYAATVTEVSGYVTAATDCDINVEERSSIGSAGTNVLSSDLVCDADGASVTSSFGNSSLASGCYLWLDISAVDTTGDLQVTIAFSYTV